MNKTETGDELETSAEATSRGLKRVHGDHRKHLKNLTLKDCKSRVNIMLDADIIEFFKAQAANKGSLPYQTQINEAENSKEPNNEVITIKMLDNPSFISVLAEKRLAGEKSISDLKKYIKKRKKDDAVFALDFDECYKNFKLGVLLRQAG